MIPSAVKGIPLRKCPFCGGEAECRCLDFKASDSQGLYSVLCTDCMIRNDGFWTEQDAADWWNGKVCDT